jgi:hypothetical protein
MYPRIYQALRYIIHHGLFRSYDLLRFLEQTKQRVSLIKACKWLMRRVILFTNMPNLLKDFLQDMAGQVCGIEAICSEVQASRRSCCRYDTWCFRVSIVADIEEIVSILTFSSPLPCSNDSER